MMRVHLNSLLPVGKIAEYVQPLKIGRGTSSVDITADDGLSNGMRVFMNWRLGVLWNRKQGKGMWHVVSGMFHFAQSDL